MPLEIVHQPGEFRPRSDQAHVAAQHIDKLQGLIQMGLAQDPAKRRDPVIIFLGHLLHPARLIALVHRAEFIDREGVTALSCPDLCEGNRPARFQ